ncbi:MAG: hypothetical protein KGD73_03345 [Candidatus Lokiarchaeota archaeon]|nr:hypothetical protein [Candidatus Lokiarchaeota archaeon]
MEKIIDLHIHSRFSGGTSKRINIFNIALNSKIKGLDIVGTGDCLHPSWFEELKSELEEFDNGIYYHPKIPEIKFILQTEIELIWKIRGEFKRVHFIILIPNFQVLNEVYQFLSTHGTLKEDGRPKIYLSVENFILEIKKIDSLIEIIPAHIFTPYFGILGAHCNFKSFKEALGEGRKHIYAVESGLSADPTLIRNLSELDDLTIISNSDAHSVNFHRLGREATKIDISNNLNYQKIINSIRFNKIIKTYEFKPSGGKYYYDGHRGERHENGIDYFCSPRRNNIDCPYCGKKLTKGVLFRIYELKDQEAAVNADRFQYIIPLLQLIATVNRSSEYNKKNLEMYRTIMENNQGEYNVWEGSSNFDGIPSKIIDAINKIRDGKYYYIPGHDNFYGSLCFEHVE